MHAIVIAYVSVGLVLGGGQGDPILVCLESFTSVGLDEEIASKTQSKIARILTELGARVIRASPEGGKCASESEADATRVDGLLKVRAIQGGSLVHLTVQVLDVNGDKEIAVRSWKTSLRDLLVGESLTPSLRAILTVLRPPQSAATSPTASPKAAEANKAEPFVEADDRLFGIGWPPFSGESQWLVWVRALSLVSRHEAISPAWRTKGSEANGTQWRR